MRREEFHMVYDVVSAKYENAFSVASTLNLNDELEFLWSKSHGIESTRRCLKLTALVCRLDIVA